MKSLSLLLVVLVGVAMVESGVVRQMADCPMMCITLYAPVCGSDGNTYSNTCQLNVAACLSGTQITVASKGNC